MFGGSWGQQNQQQQQPQQQQFGFGGQQQQQPNTGFGQPQATGFGQQAQQNTGGGLFGGGGQSTFGAPAQNTANSNFTFGGNNQAQQTNAFGGARPGFGATGGSTFGQPAANTGGGLFGGANATPAFGGANNSTFGKPATSTFGGAQNTSGGMFGAPAQNAFGGAGMNNNNNQEWNPNVVHDFELVVGMEPPSTGTAQPLYQPTWHKDPPNPGQPGRPPPPPTPASNLPHLYNSITAMRAYRGASFDELRFMDYEQNRKEAGASAQQQPAAGGFGQPAAGGFGQQQQQQQGGFGQPQASTGLFGAKPAGGMFGAAAPAATGFGGASTGGGLFGQPAANTNTGGIFGQSQQNAQPAGGLFGAPAQPQQPAGGLFGQQPQQQQQQPGGLFSNPNPFGQQQQQQAQPAAGGFSFGGANATKPAFGAAPAAGGFGQTNTASTGFGQPAQPSTGFSFGGAQQQQQQQQPAAGGGLFGGGGGFGANATQPAAGGLFGQNNQQQQQQPAQGGGLFGAAAKPATGGLFGAAPAATGSTGFSFGGQNNQQQQQPAANTGMFGAPAAANTGGLFGQQNQQQQPQAPAAGGGLFGGASTTGGGLFGAKPATTGGLGGGLFGAQPAQPAAQPGGLFGGGQSGGLFGAPNNNTLGQPQQQNNGLNKPATGGLFGGGGGGMFGQPQQQQQQPGATGGMFGQQSTTGGGLFGSTNQAPAQNNGLGGSLFGGGLGGLGQSQNQQQGQQQPTLTASIDQNPYGNNPLFAYSGQTLDLGSSSKKPALPPLTSSTFRLTPTRKNQVNKLRGFASPAPSPRGLSPLNGLTTPGRSVMGTPVAADRYKGLSDTVLPPNAFVPRPSIKRLTVTPKSGSYGSEDHLESVLGKSALRSSGSTPAPTGRAAAPSPAAQSPATLLFNPPAASSSNGSTARPAETPSQRDSTSRSAVVDRQPKQGDYWCRPKLEKLKQLSDRDLRDMHNFTAGRKGHGEVTFLEPVDLTDVDLDTFLGTVIVFGDMELIVYPDDMAETKPERGDGLNVPAQVTLENCWSKDKATKANITDPNDPRYGRFIKRLKCIPDTEFISFSDGLWSFKVQHFSRYGLGGESDDEDEEDEPRAAHGKEREARRDRDGSSRTASRTPSTSEDDEEPLPTKSRHDRGDSGSEHDSGFEEGEGSDRSDDERTTQSGSGSSEASDEPELGTIHEDGGEWERPIQKRLGMEGMKKLKEMQAGFFAPMLSRAMEAGAGAGGSGRVVPQKRRAEVESAQVQDFRNAGEGGHALDDRAVKRASFGENPRPKKLRQPRVYSKVPLEQSVGKGNEGVRVDAGLAWGRAGGAVWGFRGEIVHLGKICGPKADFASDSKATISVEKVNLLAESDQTEAARADRLLRLHLARSEIALVDGVPTAAIDSTIRFADFAKLFDAGDRSHEANVFRLGVALFDEIDLRLPIDASDDLASRAMEVRRKLALSRWLQDAVAPAVDAELVKSDSQPAKLFSLLSGNQVERAVQSAIEGNDMRLATLFAQIGSGDAFRGEMQRQLDDWKKYKASPLISPEYRRLYALLAGVTDVLPGDTSRGVDGCADVVISKDLDWKRAFGVQMWFGNHFEDPISTILDSFTNALTSPHPPATPLPPYLEKPSPLERSWTMSSQPTDILFGLIRLYSDPALSLDQVLRSRDASASPYDMRIIWHLYILLSQVLGKRDWEDRDTVEGYSAQADRVTVGYAAQLEGQGDWLGAAFVLMHLETSEGRESALRALLHRHPEPTPTERQKLVETLQIPKEWLHESKAALLASAGDAYGEFHECLKAGLGDRAHRVLVSKLLPEVILRDDLVLVKRLCAEVEGRAEGWEYGAKLFQDYANVCEEVPRLLTSVLRERSSSSSPDRLRLAELARTVPRLIQLLPAVFPDRGNVQQVAGLGDMLSNLHHLAGSLYAAGYIARPAVSSSMVDVDRLHLLQAASLDSFTKSLGACMAA